MKGKVFSTEMVQSILNGDKTQFREPIKNINVEDEPMWITGTIETDKDILSHCPYQAGDIIFVKETWLKADDGYHYKADIPVPSESEDLRIAYGYKYKPALYMSKEAARIFLKIKNIKAQRLCDIKEDEIKSEAISYDEEIYNMPCNIENAGETYLKGCFMRKWNSKYEKKGYGWNENPWVWRIEFERVKKSKG